MPAPDAQYLRALSYRFPTPEAALAEIAHLRAVLALPRGTVHVVSDVHGEYQKLEHVLRNGSGALRSLVERLLPDLDEATRTTLLNLVYYPRETWARAGRAAIVHETIERELVLLRALVSRYSLRHAERIFPAPYAEV